MAYSAAFVITLITVAIAKPEVSKLDYESSHVLIPRKDLRNGPYTNLPVYNHPMSFYGPPSPHLQHEQPPETIVTKNVYVHVPPEEPEIFKPAVPVQMARPNKHYKIIFIKAPNPPAPQRLVVPPPVQDEHKTLVYVLVKKPEEPEQLVLPPPSPTQPSKPEVYFIKYKEHHKVSEQYGPPAPVTATVPETEYGLPKP